MDSFMTIRAGSGSGIESELATKQRRRPCHTSTLWCALVLGCLFGNFNRVGSAAEMASAEAGGSKQSLDEIKDRLKEDEKRKAGQRKNYPEGPEGELLSEIDAGLARLPKDTRTSGMTAKRLGELVDQLIAKLDFYTRKYPESARTAEIYQQLGRLAAMNFQRAVAAGMSQVRERLGTNLTPDQVEQVQAAYLSRSLGFLDEADRRSPSKELQVDILQTRANLLFRGKKHTRARLIYEKLEKDFAGQGRLEENLMALIKCLDKCQLHEAALARVRELKTRFPKSEYGPAVTHLEARLLLYLGQLSEVVRHLESNREYFNRAFTGEPVGPEQVVYPPRIRRDFESFVERFSFDLAFAHYALGNIDAAKAELEKSLALLSEKGAAKKLTQVGRIFLDRTIRLRSVFEELQGKPAPGLGRVDIWIGDRMDLDQAKERREVVALLFFPYGNARAEEYLRATQKYYGERWSEGFRSAWISYPTGFRDFDKQKAALEAEVGRMAITMPTGLMTAEKAPVPLCEEYKLGMPTPTLVVLDADGNVAWYKQDPTYRDFEVSHAVMTRLLRARQ